MRTRTKPTERQVYQFMDGKTATVERVGRTVTTTGTDGTRSVIEYPTPKLAKSGMERMLRAFGRIEF